MRPLGKPKFLTDIVKGCKRFMITVFDYYISNSVLDTLQAVGYKVIFSMITGTVYFLYIY